MPPPIPARLAAAAAAIANARGGRRGAPEIVNILDILPENLRDEVLEDAQAALDAAEAADPRKLPVAPADPAGIRTLTLATYSHTLGSQATVLLDVAQDGVVTVSSWAEEPGTKARAIGTWANSLQQCGISTIPFRTDFGHGNGGVPLPLSDEEWAALSDAERERVLSYLRRLRGPR